METKQDIAARIKELIFKKGMSITQFAAGAKIDQSNLSSILNRKRSIGSGVISKIALAYDINPEWLTTGEGNMYKLHNTLSESNSVYGSNMDYTSRYIKHLEEEVVSLRKTIEEQSQVIQGLINGNLNR
jgi:transcriptional regulator with XRE-family HTH domain